jgi:hypothetical protein
MSFQAVEWARSLPLDSLSAKFTLMMIGSYADTKGTCFPSVATLATDTLQSEATVRRRIRELEQIGLLVCFQRWETPDRKIVIVSSSETGRPLGARRSSNQIRLRLDIRPEKVSALVAKWRAENGPSDEKDSERPHAKLQGEEGDSAMQRSPLQGSDSFPLSQSCECLNSQLKKESPPLPPQDGGDGQQKIPNIGIERMKAIELIWPEPITDAHRTTTVLSALTETEWSDCLTGAKGYASFICSKRAGGKDRAVKDFHNWARNRQWAGFLTAGQTTEEIAQRRHVAIDSPEGRALAVLYKIAHLIMPFETIGRYLLMRPLSQQALALADAPNETQWLFIAADQTNQVGAWKEFLARELAGKARPELCWDRNYGKGRGFYAPWPWPPRKDGSISARPPTTFANG